MAAMTPEERVAYARRNRTSGVRYYEAPLHSEDGVVGPGEPDESGVMGFVRPHPKTICHLIDTEAGKAYITLRAGNYRKPSVMWRRVYQQEYVNIFTRLKGRTPTAQELK